MKKHHILFCFLALCCLGSAMAQDTVRYPDPWYSYAPRTQLYGSSDRSIYTDVDGTFGDANPCDYINYEKMATVRSVTDTNYTLYGLAVTISEWSDEVPYRLYILHGAQLSPTTTPSIYNLYGEYSSIDTITFATAPLIKQCKFLYDYTLPKEDSIIAHCYEIYFDSPVKIHDSIHIGFSRGKCNKFVCGRNLNCGQIWYEVYLDYYYWYRMCNPFLPSASCAAPQDLPYEPKSVWGAIFPIVQPRCTAPKGLRMVDDGDALRAVWWADTNADVFQLALCPDTTPPELGTLTTLTDTSLTLPALPADSYHRIYLRKMCTFTFNTTGRTDTVWSDWSGPLHIGSPAGITLPETPVSFSISPNPAGDEATLLHDANQGEVAVLDIRGRTLLTQPATQHTLDTSTLPAGTYLVRLTTPQGTATRKLVINK